VADSNMRATSLFGHADEMSQIGPCGGGAGSEGFLLWERAERTVSGRAMLGLFALMSSGSKLLQRALSTRDVYFN